MHLTAEQRIELESVLRVGYDGSVSARAQIVLWWDDGHSAAEIATMNGATRPTVYKWVDRYAEGGLAALEDRVSTGRPQSISAKVWARILALTVSVRESRGGHALIGGRFCGCSRLAGVWRRLG